jgi:hypothetical protein
MITGETRKGPGFPDSQIVTAEYHPDAFAAMTECTVPEMNIATLVATITSHGSVLTSVIQHGRWICCKVKPRFARQNHIS